MPDASCEGSTVAAMQLADLVNEAHTVDPTATVVEAARRMADADVGSLAVMQGGRLIGIFTERDPSDPWPRATIWRRTWSATP